MGKVKKGKKLDYEDEVEDHIEAERTADDDVSSKTKKKEKKGKEAALASDSEDESVTKQKKKKDKKKSKSEDVEEPTESLQELTISKGSKKEKKKGKASAVLSDDENELVKAGKGKKSSKKESESEEDEDISNKKRGGKGGFCMLGMSDEDDEEDKEESDKDEEEEQVIQSKTKDTKKAGGKKSKRKKKDEDENDLDQILAELEMEYTGQVVAKPGEEPAKETNEEEKDLKKSKKKEKKKEEVKVEEKVDEGGDAEDGCEDGEDGRTMKSAAQKRKEKKEREKLKKQAEKIKVKESTPVEIEKEQEVTPEPEEKPEEDGDEDDDDKKKKKKKKGTKEDKDKGKGLPNKRTIAAMQEALKKIKEEEEKLKREEEERLKKEEEVERQRLEQLRLEQEKKDRKKAREKERKERLKAEGKLLTAKQKADKARAEEMIKAMKAMYGDAAVVPGGKPKKEVKKKKSESDTQQQQVLEQQSSTEEKTPGTNIVQVEIVEASGEPAQEEDVKDSWDADSGDEQPVKEDNKTEAEQATPKKQVARKVKEVMKEEVNGEIDKGGVSEEESEETESGSDGSDSDESDEEPEEKKTDAERKREKALSRIKMRQEDAEKKMSLDELRAAVVCVLGHVDTGKTKILDKLRRTNVQDGEAGGITQQIGATNVPIDCIKEQTKHVKGFAHNDLKIPGLLIIDTPGHESFSNLRSRGSSLCDIAILVVDIMHGLEPQTIESLNLLKQRKTPFIVALNKIDRLYDWQTMNRKDVRDIIKSQASNTLLEFEQRAKEVIIQFAEQGMNAALFYENPDIRSYISLVPTSAITGEGMGNLLSLIVESCQGMLAKRLMFSEELQATVLEVKAIPGLGTTIDVILVNGYLREGDSVVLAGTEAPIVTQIRSLLMPQPLKELRVKNAYAEHKEVKAAQGVKIAAKDLEKVIAGLNLRVAYKSDEVDILKEEVNRELKSALSSIKLQERGVYVQASTLGSLEALLEFLRTSNIPYANIRIGPVVKKDVMKASTMLEHDSQYATILAFDVKIERDAQELADSVGVKIFQADIIYHLFDKFMAYRDELKRKKREEFRSIAVFPCKLRILPQFIFNSRDPIVVGVMVEAGIVKEGTPICVPSKEFVDIGIVTSIEVNHKNQEAARKGQEVCIKIEPIPGEAPKMFGRHFDEKDLLISKISRQSIDACKDYFREDLVKTDWQLMVELKKLFQIL